MCRGQQRVQTQQEEHGTVHRNDLRYNVTQSLGSLDLLGYPHDDRMLFAFVRGTGLREVQSKKVFEETRAESALQMLVDKYGYSRDSARDLIGALASLRYRA